MNPYLFPLGPDSCALHQLVQIRLTTLLSRKTLPKDALVVIARALTIHRQAISTATREGNELAHQLLDLDPSGYFEADKLAAIVEQKKSRRNKRTEGTKGRKG